MIEADDVDAIREQLEGLRSRRRSEEVARAVEGRLESLAREVRRAARDGEHDRPEDLEDALDRLVQSIKDQWDLTRGPRAELLEHVAALRATCGPPSPTGATRS